MTESGTPASTCLLPPTTANVDSTAQVLSESSSTIVTIVLDCVPSLAPPVGLDRWTEKVSFVS